KSEQRFQLSLTIDLQDFKVMPCSFCVSKGLECKMMKSTKQYFCYIRWSCSCNDSDIPVNALSRITIELDCLDRKELDAEEVLFKLQSKLDEAIARLMRLQKQKRSLHNCSAKIIS
ncbi:hypothetical protein M406DRAFT_252424, partial [Cryphonectria parasitica EP155]